MKLVKVEPRDIAVIIEFSEQEIRKLERFLSQADIAYTNPELEDAAVFVTNQFYPNLQTILKGLDT